MTDIKNSPNNGKKAATAALTDSPMPIWLEGVLGGIYKAYFKFLKTQSLKHKDHSKKILDTQESGTYADLFGQSKIDALATRIGATYRGIGILVGALSAAIILCALLPVGIELTHDVLLAVGVTKVTLMFALLIILFFTRRLNIKERWVNLRRAAEYKRYDRLRALIALADTSQTEDAINSLREEVMIHIGGGPECQIVYNQKKWSEYEGIEAFSVRLTYLAFSVSLAGAALHLVLHASWLIFLTAYLPALIGAMHAVNSFLRLPQLIDQHGEMILVLSGLRNQLPADTSTLESRTKFLKLSQKLIERLQNVDDRWLSIASQQNLHPV